VTDRVFQGLPVWCCSPGSPAERAGVRSGDILLIANGQRIDTASAYLNARERYNDRLELTVQRGNRVIDFVLHFQQSWRDDVIADDASMM
jgi:S1-C subfamily serine protease